MGDIPAHLSLLLLQRMQLRRAEDNCNLRGLLRAFVNLRAFVVNALVVLDCGTQLPEANDYCNDFDTKSRNHAKTRIRYMGNLFLMISAKHPKEFFVPREPSCLRVNALVVLAAGTSSSKQMTKYFFVPS